MRLPWPVLARESRGTHSSSLVFSWGGVAAVGVFLVAAAEGSIASAVILGLVAAGCLIGGISLASAGARRRGGRGGLLSAEPTLAERRQYRLESPRRHGHHA